MESLSSTKIKFTSALHVTKHYVTTGNVYLSKAIDKHYRNRTMLIILVIVNGKSTRLKINHC